MNADRRAPARSAAAAVVAVGDELIEGRLQDANSHELARLLGELGLLVARIEVVGDDEQALAALLSDRLAQHALVVVTGGLGPTLDDVTRHAAARALRVGLVESPEARVHLERWWAGRDSPMPAANLRQALVPEGAELLPNEVGTAAGFACDAGGALLAVLPGPPHEMRHVFARELAPRLARRFPPSGGLARAAFHLTGLAESAFAERAGAWMERGENPRMGVTAGHGALAVTLLARGASSAEAERALEVRRREFRERFGAHVYSEDEPRLEQVVGRELLARGITLATAESCTGGMLAAALTRVSGISAVFRAGWVTYANESKVDALGVDPALIARAGAVSGEMAEAMARGAAARAGARLAASITGVAGPDGGTAEKPVGLVWIGLCADGRAQSHQRRFPPADRERVRRFAVTSALALLLREIRALDRRADGAPRASPVG